MKYQQKKTRSTPNLTSKNNKAGKPTDHQRPHHYITHSVKNSVYLHTLRHVQQQLSPTEKILSRFSHNAAVESTSDLIGSSLLHPKAVFGGALTMVFGGTAIVLLARHIGFSVSPFLLIALYLIGFTATMIILLGLKIIRRITIGKHTSS